MAKGGDRDMRRGKMAGRVLASKEAQGSRAEHVKYMARNKKELQRRKKEGN